MSARCQAYKNAYKIFHLEMKSISSDKSSSEDTSKFSKYSRASWTFINILAAFLYSHNIQIKELTYDVKVTKQTAYV